MAQINGGKVITTPLCAMVFASIFPCLMDVPALVNGNYISVTGKVLAYEIPNKDAMSEKNIEILDEETEQCLERHIFRRLFDGQRLAKFKTQLPFGTHIRREYE